ncbi:MAG TPA: hypothetical protein VHE54_05850 [Puia sp.]|nr:hypothetical protein [Puia sp.]
MYDPKFEKAVQGKMEELEFRPSESVWVNIEKAVSGYRRRRAVPIFWRIALPAVLLTAAAGAYYFGAGSGTRPGASVRAGSTGVSTAGATGVSRAGATGVSRAGATGVSRAGATGAAGQAGPAASSVGAQTTGSPVLRDGTEISARVGANGASMAGGTGISARVGANGASTAAATGRAGTTRPYDRVTRTGGHLSPVDETNVAADGKLAARQSHDPSSAAAKMDPERTEAEWERGAGTAGSMEQTRHAARQYLPRLEDQRLSYGVSARALRAETGMVQLKNLSRPRRPWEAGFVAGGGIDRLNRLDASRAIANVSYLASSFYSLNQSAVNKNSISDVRPDASFFAGVYLQKAVSSRWTFNTGLDLHYYSVRMSVGQQLDTYVPASASLLAPVAFAAAPQTLYTVGNRQTYTNRYYLLELPVAMQYRINRSRMLPIFVEGGALLSRVMGANALFYNPATGLYVKSEDELNKTQVDLSSSLLVGLPVHGIRILAGPQVQYGLTPLINSRGLGDQHFLFMGVRLVVLPGRK